MCRSRHTCRLTKFFGIIAKRAYTTIRDLRVSTLMQKLLYFEFFPVKRPECWTLNAECVICMDRQRACILAPCHHLCTCASCGELLVNRKDSCPICRRSITHTVPFYFS